MPLNVGYLDPHDQSPAFENVSYDFFITKGRDQFSASPGSAGDVTARLLLALSAVLLLVLWQSPAFEILSYFITNKATRQISALHGVLVTSQPACVQACVASGTMPITSFCSS